MRVLLLTALLAFPVDAAETHKQDVYCDGEWCAIRQETLQELVNGTRKLSEYVRRIETLCRWPQ